MPLARFNKVKLGALPTPLEPLDALTRLLGGPRLFVKRDDCTGLATGGNKTRKLEYLIADALAQKCDVVLTAGGLQSNHCRQTAAAAAKFGLKCELFLEAVDGVPAGQEYTTNGNILLDRLLGATIHKLAANTDREGAMIHRAEAIRSDGGQPYIVPVGGSNGLGALGYVACAHELLQQCRDQGVQPDYIMLPTGSCGTQAGMLAGLVAGDSDITVIGVNVSAEEAAQKERLQPVLTECCDLVEVPVPDESRIICDDRFYPPGYGIPNDGTLEAVRLLARNEGLLLDPVYTGKCMAGLIERVRNGVFAKDDTVVFLHTGGSSALFAYKGIF